MLSCMPKAVVSKFIVSQAQQHHVSNSRNLNVFFLIMHAQIGRCGFVHDCSPVCGFLGIFPLKKSRFLRKNLPWPNGLTLVWFPDPSCVGGRERGGKEGSGE